MKRVLLLAIVLGLLVLAAAPARFLPSSPCVLTMDGEINWRPSNPDIPKNPGGWAWQGVVANSCTQEVQFVRVYEEGWSGRVGDNTWRW